MSGLHNIELSNLILKYWFDILKKIYIISILYSPTSSQAVVPSNGQKEGAQFNPLSLLLTQPFGSFRRFCQNLLKYGLGSNRKTSHHGGHSPSGPGTTCEQLALSIQPTNSQLFCIFESMYVHLRIFFVIVFTTQKV